MRSLLTTKRIGRRPFIAALAGAGAVGLRRGTEAQATRTVRFAFFGTAAELQTYRSLIQAFQQVHPEIVIEPVASLNSSQQPSGWPQGSYMEWLNTAFVGAQPPDVFLINYRQFGSYAARGVIEPLAPYLTASKTIQASDFFPIALDSFRWTGFDNNGVGAIPQNVSSLVVYCNLDRFREAGVSFPTNGWSWDEFGRAAQKLTYQPNKNQPPSVYGLVVDPTIARAAPFIWGAGGELIDNLAQPTRLMIDTKAAQRGLTWFAALGQAGLRVTPNELEARTQSNLDRFRFNGAAMLIESRRVVPLLRQTPGLHWDVAPLPVGERRANVLHSDGFAMWAGAADKEAAWSFIEFAVGPAGQKVLAASGRTVPSLQALAASPAFLEGSEIGKLMGLSGLSLAPAHGHVYLDNVPSLNRLPSAANWPGVELAFNRAFQHAFYVDADIPAAIRQAISTSDNVLSSLILPPGVETAEDE